MYEDFLLCIPEEIKFENHLNCPLRKQIIVVYLQNRLLHNKQNYLTLHNSNITISNEKIQVAEEDVQYNTIIYIFKTHKTIYCLGTQTYMNVNRKIYISFRLVVISGGLKDIKQISQYVNTFTIWAVSTWI